MTSRLLGKIDLSRFNLGPEVSYLNGFPKGAEPFSFARIAAMKPILEHVY